MFLSKKDIRNLTDKKQYAAQAKQLDIMGITYHRRGDGSPAVSQKHIDKLFDGEYSANDSSHVEPNWKALEDAQAA